MSDIIASLIASGHAITYAEAPGTGGFFADLRDGDGQCLQTGNGPTKAMALDHLAYRLERDELAGELYSMLGEGCHVSLGRDADGSYFADITTAAGTELSGTGATPGAALRSAKDDAGDLEPYCETCGGRVGHFIGHEGWWHYFGLGTAESRTELYEGDHPVAVAWREPAAESAL